MIGNWLPWANDSRVIGSRGGKGNKALGRIPSALPGEDKSASVSRYLRRQKIMAFRVVARHATFRRLKSRSPVLLVSILLSQLQNEATCTYHILPRADHSAQLSSEISQQQCCLPWSPKTAARTKKVHVRISFVPPPVPRVSEAQKRYTYVKYTRHQVNFTRHQVYFMLAVHPRISPLHVVSLHRSC